MKKFKKNSVILEAVYEIAGDLYACGVISDERMKEYENDCLETLPVSFDYDVFECINQKYGSNREKVQVLINDLLRKEFQIARSVL